MITTYAILTGDIIDSRKLSAKELEAVFEQARQQWAAFNQHHGGAVVGTLEVFRGG